MEQSTLIKGNMDSISTAMEEIHSWAINAGWYDDEVSFLSFMTEMSVHIQEAKNLINAGFPYSEVWIEDTGPGGIPQQFAKMLITLLDFCQFVQIDLVDALKRQMEFNLSRKVTS